MFEVLVGVPVMVKVLAALGLILILNQFCRHLLVSVGAAALMLAVWCGHSPPRIGLIAWERLSSPSNLILMLIIFQVIWLSSQMSETGVMEDLVFAVRRMVSRRGAVAVLPAVIGLLPMPGGALFSAPLVESCDPAQDLTNRLKAQTNHWFRHVWEYWWPLYPGILLAIEITGLDMWQYVLMGLPLTAGSILSGYYFLLRRVEPEEESAAVEEDESVPSFFWLVLPIVVVVGGYTLLKLAHYGTQQIWPGVGPINRMLPMAFGLFCAMTVLQFERPLPRKKWKEIIFSRRALNMALIVAAVRVYGAFIEARLPNGTLLVAQMRSEMADLGIPLVAVVMLIPLISGLATGISLGFVGASFPIVLRLLGADPTVGEVVYTTVLAYGFGYMGMLISPVHVCLVVTCEYFKTDVMPNILGMLKPALAMLTWTVVLHVIYRLLLG